ncbi:MAG: glycosyltransferase family 2 protein [Bacteroidales bacterium]
MKTLFWISLFVVFYTYVGYGILLCMLVKIKEFFSKPAIHQISPADFPYVSLLIAAYNEEKIVDEKMSNCFELGYPKDKLKIVWITDGSTDSTNEKLSRYSNTEVLFEPKRGGKTAALNRAMNFINTDIVIFTDANTILNKDSITEIVNAFSDPKVGCVAGEKRIALTSATNTSSLGEGAYWKYESVLKEMDSRLNTTAGAAGELFAVRKDLYEYVEEDTLLDDFIISMRIAKKGYKIRYCKNAYAVEGGSLNMREEKKRKVRIAAGGIQSVIRLSSLLNIFKYPLLSFQYISHRVLRWTITPVLLISLFPFNIILVLNEEQIIYKILLSLQILFYLAAYTGKIFERRNIKLSVFLIPYYFMFMNFNVFSGLIYLLKKKRGDGTWEKAKRAD